MPLNKTWFKDLDEAADKVIAKASSASPACYVSAIRRYKRALEAAYACPEMILSTGRSDEAARLMMAVEEAREALFNLVET